MPNGKGSIDCCYCKHFGGARGYPDGHGQSALCLYHGVTLPAPTPEYLNRICCHFEPDESYWHHNHFWSPPARRFAWFARDLQPGVLYMFGYNTPDKIEREVVLREPDYHAGDWKKT
jgi:hypothetical protein